MTWDAPRKKRIIARCLATCISFSNSVLCGRPPFSKKHCASLYAICTFGDSGVLRAESDFQSELPDEYVGPAAPKSWPLLSLRPRCCLYRACASRLSDPFAWRSLQVRHKAGRVHIVTAYHYHPSPVNTSGIIESLASLFWPLTWLPRLPYGRNSGGFHRVCIVAVRIKINTVINHLRTLLSIEIRAVKDLLPLKSV